MQIRTNPWRWLRGLVAVGCLIQATGCVSLEGRRTIAPILSQRDSGIIARIPTGTSVGTDSGFSLWLSREDIEAWPGDSASAALMLHARFGPDATIRVNGFETLLVPPTTVIESVHVRRGSLAATVAIDIVVR